MNEIYTQMCSITSSEVDAYGNCRASALLRFFQDMANAHSVEMGIGREDLLSGHGAFWMLARVWLRLRRPLKMGEELEIRTWHRGPGGLILYRDFDLTVDGEPVGEAVSAWIVADFQSRKMLRPGTIASIAASPVPETVKDKQLKLIRTPKEREFVYTKTVRFSDLDVNGHMNNTKYADVILDALTPEELRGRFLAEMQLNYSQECLAGESVDICRQVEEDHCYIDGCGGDGARRFEAILQFQMDPVNSLDEGEDSE